MRLFQSRQPQQQPQPERLLWARDIRFANRVAAAIPGSRALELDAGSAIIGPAATLTERLVADVAESVHAPAYGLVDVDAELPVTDRYLVALSEAVRLSGLADRVGMAPSSQIVQTKTLDYFFNLRNRHAVQFQPIVRLDTGALHEYECLFRPEMPMLPQSISAIVQAAIDTDRSVELDVFIIAAILERAGGIQAARLAAGEDPFRFSINLTPASLLDDRFEAKALVEMVRAAGLAPSQLTVECTEQQAVSDIGPLKRQVKALRRQGFGFAVDDAGAGYASFALIAALRPSVIKIDREITRRSSRDDAKQALIEAFVSFAARIGARLLAEGIETRAELAKLRELGVELGQGYLLGRPSSDPARPRVPGETATHPRSRRVRAIPATRVTAGGR